LNYSAPLPTVDIQIQPGLNGNYLPFATRAIKDSNAWFYSLGFRNSQPRIDYLFGRTIKWLESKIDEVAPGCRANALRYDPNWYPGGSGSLCAESWRGGVYSHIINAVGRGAYPDEVSINMDVSKFALDRHAWHMFPHETFHNWQGSICSACYQLPNWMLEGGAQLFTYMLWSKLESSPNAYLDFDAEEVAWPRDLCKNPLSGPLTRNAAPVGCDYSKGMVAMEFFIYKFGIEGYKKLWSQIQPGDVNTEFLRLLGTSYIDFNKQLGDYLELKGWGR